MSFHRWDPKHQCMKVLQALNLFDEKELYGIILDYALAKLTLSPDVPFVKGYLLRDRVGLQPVKPGQDATFRFIFSSYPLLATLGQLEIGLTIQSEPFTENSRNRYISHNDTDYVNIFMKSDKYTAVRQVIMHDYGKEIEIDVTNHLDYIDVEYSVNQLKVVVAYSKSRDDPLQSASYSMKCSRFSNSLLYPFLNTRKPVPFPVSIHSLL